MPSRKKKKTAKTPNMGCLILFAGMIGMIILFVIKFPDIKTTLEKTNFLKVVSEKVSTTSVQNKQQEQKAIPLPSAPVVVSTQAPSTSTTMPSSGDSSAALQAGESEKKTAESRQATLYFVRIENDGLISTSDVRRNIPISGLPLTDAISALFAGPSEAEIRTGLVSLIPRGTKLISVAIRGSTAVIDVSDSFMYNHYGREGYQAQLKQVVYTATSFSSVQDVQFLIDGKTRDYLGGDGIFIGTTLSRNSF
jgi:spore germination protein GerM